ncbi:MAG: response regulator transcription factor [Treponema sp.]|jgi:DNA-binding response OmpR family regulator|nr:response regulator transcription factor [Treponema sp.]
MKKRVLIIEDDAAIAGIERDNLEVNGFDAEIAWNGNDGLRMALTGAYDLLLVDLMLPGINGFDLCAKLRSQLDVPLIMVTARGEDIDKIRGLGLGADDYVTKPFSPAELVARVRAHIAQYERLTGEKGKTRELVFGRLRVNPAARRVFVDEKEVILAQKEYELLLFLVQRPHTVFDKEALYGHIWGEDRYGDLKTVAVHIQRLREKIEADPSSPRYVQTVWGAGYRFTP